jgi:ubiquinone/menaquinone biosynthesis C-methylase UbiE
MTEVSGQTRSPHFAEDSTARTYREVHLPHMFTPWARILLEVVPTRSGDAVLDVATGPGTVAREAALAAGPYGRVIGVDISPAMLKVARDWPPSEAAAPIEYIQASGASIPLPDAAFTIAYCQQGLQHMTDPLAALREMRRLLTDAGRIGIAVWQRSPFGVFREVVGRFTDSNDGIQPSSFGRDSAELVQALREAGFLDVAVQTREFTAVLEGGIAQALQVATATSASAGMRDVPAERQQRIREALTQELQAYVHNGAVWLPSEAHIASARTT